MKTGIHPTYYPKATVKCACGKVFTVGSTKENMEIEICSNCHPFYTGQEKLVDTLGMVEKFRKRVQKAQYLKAEKKAIFEKPSQKTKAKNRKTQKIKEINK